MASQSHVAAVRRFNRFYTREVGALSGHFLDSPFSLTEVRVLYEVAHRPGIAAADLKRELGIDAGYLSRMLAGFARRGLVIHATAAGDARRKELSLSAKGGREFARIEARQRSDVRKMLERAPERDQRALVRRMDEIQKLLVPNAPPSRSAIALRPHRHGDMGWIVHRQAILYHDEYGWNEEYESIVADIVGKFLEHFDPARERCWIAERDGEILGSVFCVKKSDTVAKLRLLYVEPSARGTGLGTRLVNECIEFARKAGYRKLTLWTNSVLVAARRIYEATGFKLVRSEKNHIFGKHLVSQTWDLDLGSTPHR